MPILEMKGTAIIATWNKCHSRVHSGVESMGLIVLFVVATLVVWTIAIWSRWGPPISFSAPKRQELFVGSLFATIFTQIWLGHDFWHWDVGPIPITLDRVFLGVAALLWCCDVWATRGQWIRFDGMDLAVVFWLLVITFSTLTNDYTFRDNMPLSRLLFFNFLPVVFYVFLKHSSLSAQVSSRMNLFWLVLSTSLAMLAIAEWRGWHDLIYPRYIVESDFVEFLGRGGDRYLIL
ncbi:MAG: hypothetical protein R3C03_04565 [Pirellulaceae bacterium]